MPTLARLNVTPMKGSTLLHPTEAMLTDAGIPGDRLFYLVDRVGAPYSGSTFGPLVRVRADHDASTERLTLHLPQDTRVEGPANQLGAAETTDMYGRPVPAHVVEGPFAEALSEFCGTALRLLRCDRDGDGSDVEPLTIVSSASVDELAERGGHAGDLDARRFRMTLELNGCDAYEEDSWAGRRVSVGEAVIEVGDQVPRCVFTTFSPETGEKDWNTLRQLALQRTRIPGSGLPFGMYARVVSPGRVRVGDLVAPGTSNAD